MSEEDTQRLLEQARADARAAGVVMGDTIKKLDGPPDTEGVSFEDGKLIVDLAGLPPGSLVTITVRVGPEQPALPAEPPALPAEPPAQAMVKGHLGRRPTINEGAA